MKSLKHLCVGGAIALFVTLGTVSVIRGFSYFVDIYEDLRGYDYDAKIAKGYNWIGPKPGEEIDSNFLMNDQGVSLKKFPKSKSKLLLLTVIEPECEAAKESQEQFRFLQENLAGEGIDYFIVSFSPEVSPVEISNYVRSLNIPAGSFSWTGDFENVLPSIKAIVYPSHILIDSNDVVIKTFPGTSNQKVIRDRMARQVLKEVLSFRDKISPTK